MPYKDLDGLVPVCIYSLISDHMVFAGATLVHASHFLVPQDLCTECPQVMDALALLLQGLLLNFEFSSKHHFL